MTLPQKQSEVLKFFVNPTPVERCVATDKARVTVYLPQDLKDRLSMIAEKDKRSVSVLIEILILEALEVREQGKK